MFNQPEQEDIGFQILRSICSSIAQHWPYSIYYPEGSKAQIVAEVLSNFDPLIYPNAITTDRTFELTVGISKDIGEAYEEISAFIAKYFLANNSEDLQYLNLEVKKSDPNEDMLNFLCTKMFTENPKLDAALSHELVNIYRKLVKIDVFPEHSQSLEDFDRDYSALYSGAKGEKKQKLTLDFSEKIDTNTYHTNKHLLSSILYLVQEKLNDNLPVPPLKKLVWLIINAHVTGDDRISSEQFKQALIANLASIVYEISSSKVSRYNSHEIMLNKLMDVVQGWKPPSRTTHRPSI